MISIKNSGIGIAPDRLPKLFEMFSQVDDVLTKLLAELPAIEDAGK